MANIRTQTRDMYLRVLSYGQPGSQKTRFSYSVTEVPELYPALAINSGGNPESAYSYELLPYIIDIEQLRDINAPYDWIYKGMPLNHTFAQEFGIETPVKSVIIDGLTGVQRLSFGHVTGNARLKPGDIGKRVGFQEFGSVLEQMTRLCSAFYTLPIHVFVTALEKVQTNASGNISRIAPLIWGQSEQEVSGQALINMRLQHISSISPTVKQYLKKTKQDFGPDDSVGLLQPDGVQQAKDQTGQLSKYMVAPTARKFYDAIYVDGIFTDPLVSLETA